MGHLSSQSFIKLHALFQFAFAVYLNWTPEVITDSGFVHSIEDELKIPSISFSAPPRSPFAYCGILLLVFAIIDLTLVVKLPTLNHILTIARCVRRDMPLSPAQPGTPPHRTASALKIASEISTLYHHSCVLLTTLRFWIFCFVSLDVCFSQESVWVGRIGPAAAATSAGGKWTAVEELKGKIVLGYAVMEILFSCWLFFALRDEERATENKLQRLISRVL
ncbi:hypothetical protein PRK78_005801 [Emydomyces testavorans]|uniref:Uncharacterized protein n=1 Tax=Emydomyces testavorans TaxID=2070801 RepID=A0AAF0DK93_9EURO|nr:hypothetical protein PRK78_005801 [Emydomyces testavorans]